MTAARMPIHDMYCSCCVERHADSLGNIRIKLLIFTVPVRCTMVQSAVLRLHNVVCPSETLVDQDYI